MAKVIDRSLPEEGLTKFAENCVMTPPLLARRLNLDEVDLEQIKHAHPNDRYEQIYQILLKWKSRNPVATWRELSQATDSGIRRTIRELYGNVDALVVDSEEKEEGRGTSPVDQFGKSPSKGVAIPPTKKRKCEKPPSNNREESVREIGVSGEDESTIDALLTYERDFLKVLQVVRYESRWFELGLALGLIAPLLEDIRKTHKDDVSECRKRMLGAWLSQQDHAHIPSWKTLCDALRSPILGNNGLANRIQRTYLS